MIKAGDERVKLAMLPKVKKSGGPTSKKGKKAISQNATKSGVYSRSIVLPNEDKAVYQQLVNRYMEEFNPTDMAETTMVTNLANLTWKKMRLDQYEQNSLIAVWNKSATLDELEKEKLIWLPRKIGWLEIYAIFGRYMKEGLEDLERTYVQYEVDISQLYQEEVNTHSLERYFTKNPELLKQILEVAKSEFSRKDIKVKDLLVQTTYIDGEDFFLLNACTDKILERRQDIAWYQDNLEEIREAQLKFKERRVMAQMEKADFSRAHDEIDRSFYRTLSELRKQHQWRREQNEVVVIQESPKK